MYMDFEKLEELRSETTKTAMEQLVKIISDTKADVKDRVEAAKVLDAMSDSIIKANLMTNVVDISEKKVDKIGKQIDKLTNGEG